MRIKKKNTPQMSSKSPYLDHSNPRHFVELPNAPIGHLKKGRNKKYAKTVFYFLNTEALRSKCTFNVKEQAVNLNHGHGMQAL